MADNNNEQDQNTPEGITKISTEKLAGFIVDALVQAKIVQPSDVKKAIEIAVEEITVSKSIGEF